MKMLMLVYRDSLQEEVFSLLKGEEIHAYTMIPKVHGMGSTGAAFGSFTADGENSVIITTLADEEAERAIDAFRALRSQLSERQQGATIPMKLMVMPCEDII